MKKKIIIIIGSIVTAVLLFYIYAYYTDSARVRAGQEPKLVIKVVNENGNKITYWGFGYKIIRYVSVSPNEPYKNNIGVKMGNLLMDYKLPEETNDLKVKSIVDKTQSLIGYACAEALELFYTDDKYEYYFSCLKGSEVIVEYTDGSEETVKEALKKDRIQISDLDNYKIEYLKYEK